MYFLIILRSTYSVYQLSYYAEMCDNYSVGCKCYVTILCGNHLFVITYGPFCRQKGSDASWLNDEEPPTQVLFECVLSISD